MKVVILGGGSKEKYYKQRKGWEVWGLNGIRPEWIPKWNRMFNLHMREHLESEWNEGLRTDIKWARKNKDIPFYVCDSWKDVPSAIIFPLSEMKFGRYNYHCGSFDLMVAFAIYLGVTEIDLHGISLVLERGEPISARACLEYWCGYAEGQGIKVTAAKDCYLFSPYHIIRSYSLVRTNRIYGFEDTMLIEDRT
jgi:hypothetical protein